MKEIKLHELVQVSNNSRITQELQKKLVKALNKDDRHLFRQWLSIVKSKQK